jgi:uncharacterized protein
MSGFKSLGLLRKKEEKVLEKRWKTIEGAEVPDVGSLFREIMTLGKEVHVGSDSQQNKRKTEFVTVVAVISPSKGGRVFYCQESVPRIRSLRERLMREVWMSVELGLQLGRFVPEECDLTVHIDANPNVNFKSSQYVKELVSMVVGNGFSAVLKPQAWCASHVADHAVKNKVIGL